VIPELDLSGRVAVVTGGSRTLGRAAARALAEAGAAVVVCGREMGSLERVVADIAAGGGRARAVVCDVSEEAQVNRLVAETLDSFGRLDVAVANAGIFQETIRAEELTAEEWDRISAVDLRGAWLTCSAAGRAMIALGEGGSIVVISSIAARTAMVGRAAYVSAKAALVGMTKALALDWAPHGIRVNALLPGFVRRDGLEYEPALREMVERRTPLGRFGEPREVGLAVLFLASPAGSFVTGASLPVDGGWLAQ
jgi:NAD(P)-dependent dehydrogenase (short-subunit alcohol dehydrogenase family)